MLDTIPSPMKPPLSCDIHCPFHEVFASSSHSKLPEKGLLFGPTLFRRALLYRFCFPLPKVFILSLSNNISFILFPSFSQFTIILPPLLWSYILLTVPLSPWTDLAAASMIPPAALMIMPMMQRRCKTQNIQTTALVLMKLPMMRRRCKTQNIQPTAFVQM